MNWTPASVVQRQINERVRTGSLVPITLPRRVLGALTVPKGAANITLVAHPAGTRVRARSGIALTVGQTGSNTAPPSVGSAYELCQSADLGYSIIPNSGTPIAANVGDFVFCQPRAEDDSGWLVEVPTGGGSNRVIGGMLRKIAEVNAGDLALEDIVALENGSSEWGDQVSYAWRYSVIPASEVVSNFAIRGRVTFESPASANACAVFGLVHGLDVQDCQFEGGLNQGAYIQRCSSISWKRNRVVGCGTTAVATGYGFEFAGCANVLVEDAQGENVRYVVTRNTASYKFTENRTKGINVFAALSDLHGGVAVDYYGTDIQPLPNVGSTAFGSSKIQLGNSNWTRKWSNQTFYDLDVIQFQVNGGGQATINDSRVVNFQVNATSGDGYPYISIFNCELGDTWISAITGGFGASGGDVMLVGCTINCGTRSAISWASTAVGGVTIQDCTINTGGKVLDVTGAAALGVSLTNVAVIGGSGTRVVVSGPNISVQAWTGVTVNGQAVAEIQGAGL